MSHHEDITRIKAVYNALGPLKDKVAFVGGATISLYRERDRPGFRVKEDVDVVIEIWQYGSYDEKTLQAYMSAGIAWLFTRTQQQN